MEKKTAKELEPAFHQAVDDTLKNPLVAEGFARPETIACIAVEHFIRAAGLLKTE